MERFVDVEFVDKKIITWFSYAYDYYLLVFVSLSISSLVCSFVIDFQKCGSKNHTHAHIGSLP